MYTAYASDVSNIWPPFWISKTMYMVLVGDRNYSDYRSEMETPHYSDDISDS